MGKTISSEKLANTFSGKTYTDWIGDLGYCDAPHMGRRTLPVAMRVGHANNYHNHLDCEYPEGNVRAVLHGAPAGSVVIEPAYSGCNRLDSEFDRVWVKRGSRWEEVVS